MNAAALDKMDEFFDFAPLDQSPGLDARRAFKCQLNEPFLTDDVTTMDWAVDSTATICPADTILPHDVHMYDAHQDFSIGQDVQQWPLFDDPERSAFSMGEGSVGLTADVTWQAGMFAPMKDLIDLDEPQSAFPPSSSLLAHVQLGLLDDNDEEGSMDALASHLDSSPPRPDPPTDLGNNSPTLDAPLVKPAAPLRQASIASWKPASAKRKGPQSRIPLEAKHILEDEFAANPYPCSWEMDIIAHQASLDVKKVRNWFNNTRARKKGGGEPQLAPFVNNLAYTCRPNCPAGGARSKHPFAQTEAVKG
jgi:hypothetical protein